MFNFRRRHYHHHHLRRRRIFTSTSADGKLVSGRCSSSMGRSKLHRQYYDQKSVGSYGGVAALQRVVPAERDVERWLSTQDAYTLHKPVRRRFKRRCVVVGGPNQQWQADLVDMSRLKQANNEITLLLTVIDVFSKRAWCIPLKSKSAAALVTAFTPLLNNRAPTTLQTDKGSEFLNRPLQRLLKEYGVHHFTTHNEDTKASIVEHYNRTLKTRMWRYFTKNQALRYVDVLQDFVRSYNDTYHRSIGMAPSAVNGANQEMVWQRLYGHDGGGTPKYRVGDRVRISIVSSRSTPICPPPSLHFYPSRHLPTRPTLPKSSGTGPVWRYRPKRNSEENNDRPSTYQFYCMESVTSTDCFM